MAVQNGDVIAEWLAPVPLVSSPVLTAWTDTTGCTQCLGWLAVAGGTTVVTLEYSTDGVNADTDFPAVTIAAGANVPFSMYGRFARARIVQSVADATKTKLYLQAKA